MVFIVLFVGFLGLLAVKRDYFEINTSIGSTYFKYATYMLYTYIYTIPKQKITSTLFKACLKMGIKE